MSSGTGNHGLSPAARNPLPPSYHDAPTPAVKSRMCNRYNTAGGCKFGDTCHYAHGEWELGKLSSLPQDGPLPSIRRRPGRFEQPPANVAVDSSFGAAATAKISVDASLAGAIIGKGGVNTKHISRVSGAKLAIRDHESNSMMRNIELEGTFDQINQASSMVRELIVSLSSNGPAVPIRKPPKSSPQGSSGIHRKTKLCDNFVKGSCTFGGKCHFAHGLDELWKGIS